MYGEQSETPPCEVYYRQNCGNICIRDGAAGENYENSEVCEFRWQKKLTLVQDVELETEDEYDKFYLFKGLKAENL